MNNESKPRPPTRKPELLPAMLAISLAVASQLAVRAGLAPLGLAGYVTAALLFVTSVGAIFRMSPPGEPTLSEPTVDGPAPTKAEVEPAAATDNIVPAKAGNDQLRYLRHHWRMVTIAEIFAGDLPPARVRMPEEGEVATDEVSTGGSESG